MIHHDFAASLAVLYVIAQRDCSTSFWYANFALGMCIIFKSPLQVTEKRRHTESNFRIDKKIVKNIQVVIGRYQISDLCLMLLKIIRDCLSLKRQTINCQLLQESKKVKRHKKKNMYYLVQIPILHNGPVDLHIITIYLFLIIFSTKSLFSAYTIFLKVLQAGLFFQLNARF